MSEWTRTTGLATVVFDFEAGGKYQMALEVGETVQLVKETTDWYKGVKVVGGDEGIFPKNYVEVLPEVLRGQV